MQAPLSKIFTILMLSIGSVVLIISLFGLGYYWSVNRLDEKPLKTALAYFKAHQQSVRNQKFLVIVDFTKPSFAKRMHILDMQSGETHSYLVAHGSANKAGSLFVPEISNAPDSHASSAGFMLTGEQYDGVYGRSLRLDGLEARNSNVRSRAIVIHGASWVGYRIIGYHLGAGLMPRIGESFGCLAVSRDDIDDVIRRLGSGALVYVHVDGPGSD